MRTLWNRGELDDGSPRIYRPRMIARLWVPVAGSSAEKDRAEKDDVAYELQVNVREASIEANDHNHADALRITMDWLEAGIDPRFLRNAVVQFYLANAKETDDTVHEVLKEENMRFIGIMKKCERSGGEGNGFVVEAEFLDYTTIFLEAKPFGSSGVPDYSQTLSQAWRCIVSQTPGAKGRLDDALRFEPEQDKGTLDIQLAKAVSARFRSFGKVQVKPETDAWAVWQQCVGSLGLISFFRQDKCVVTTATNLYTESNPPHLIWGRNILEMKESRDVQHAHGSVGITSFDPISHTTLEAVYPPKGDPRVKRKKVAAKKHGGAAGIDRYEERTYFSVPGVSNQAALDKIALRVYEERSRQELEGTLTTCEMLVPRADDPNATFDLVGLNAGDSIRVQFESREMAELQSEGMNDDQRIDALVGRGYSEELAQLMVANLKNIAEMKSDFLVKQVHTSLSHSDLGGEFKVQITYCNHIQIDKTLPAPQG